MSLNPPIREWAGLRCWVLGAGTGIGASLARELAGRGARVALSGRREEPLREVAAGMREALVRPLDVRDAAAVEAACAAIVDRWGGLDLVICMAGLYQPVRAWTLDAASARDVVEVNLVGAFNLVAAVTPVLMRQGSGTIALVSSVAGYRGLPKSLVYGPTKAALINLAESLYLDLRPKGIGVCVVNPGFVRTPLTAGNDFRMPALIGPEEAAREIVAGLGRGAFEIHFPRRFTRVLKLLRLLPPRLYFAAVRRVAP